MGVVGLISVAGSSPRVRGRPSWRSTPYGGAGLIPASAGQTAYAGQVCASPTAHPRECGADPDWSCTDEGAAGSSPRVRGRRQPRLDNGASHGLIPASAGQTPFDVKDSSNNWAHPRECGADYKGIVFNMRPLGSSPRVRGRRSPPTGNSWRSGLIPASAGQTAGDYRRGHVHRAHPRECGADHD